MSEFREQIELYALGKLSGEALEAFRARLEADPELAAEVSRELELLQAIRTSDAVDAFRGALAAQEAGWVQESQQPAALLPKKRFVVLRPFIRAIAALLLLLLVVLVFWRRGITKSPEEIFAAHFNPAEALEDRALRRDGSGADETPAAAPFFNLLRGAEADLRDNKAPEALAKIDRLRAMPESAAYADQLAWLAGLARLQNGDAEIAIRELESIRQGFSSQKRWFLALARLKAGRKEEAVTDFEALAGSSSPYAGEARKVLEEMK